MLSSLSLLLLMLLLLLPPPPPWRANRKIRRNLPMSSTASALLQIWSVIHDHHQRYNSLVEQNATNQTFTRHFIQKGRRDKAGNALEIQK
jgi:hypothetical protein